MTDQHRFAHADHFVTRCDVSISDIAETAPFTPHKSASRDLDAIPRN
jgi:hypothetical protein